MTQHIDTISAFCEIEVWLHCHFQTRKLIDIQMFGITKIYNLRLEKGWYEKMEEDLKDSLKEFEGEETESAYTVDVYLEREEDSTYFDFKNIQRIPSSKFISEHEED